MRPVGRSSRAVAAAGWLGPMLAALAACDGSSTGPRYAETPVRLDAYVTVEEMGGPPPGLHTDYCECVPGPATLVRAGRPPERVECRGEYALPYSDGQRQEVTLIGRGWRATVDYTLPVDPHLDIRVDATCVE